MGLTDNSTVNFTSAISENSVSQSSVLLTNVKNCIHALNFLVGLPTHSYVLWLIVTGRQNRIASEFFHLNLSVCEIINCLNCLFAVLFTFPLFSGFTAFIYFTIGFAITGRPLFQCLMCVERYLAVVRPVTFLKYKPLRYRLICCTTAWIITLVSCLCCMLTLLLLHIYAYAVINSTQFLLFISIQLFCLMAVLRALKQSGPGERKKEENHMKRRAFHIILITTLSMSVTYIPFTLSTFFYFLTHNFDDPVSVSVICFILAGFIQPILYLHSAGKLLCVCSS